MYSGLCECKLFDFPEKTYFASGIDWLVEARTVRAVKEMDPT